MNIGTLPLFGVIHPEKPEDPEPWEPLSTRASEQRDREAMAWVAQQLTAGRDVSFLLPGRRNREGAGR